MCERRSNASELDQEETSRTNPDFAQIPRTSRTGFVPSELLFSHMLNESVVRQIPPKEGTWDAS